MKRGATLSSVVGLSALVAIAGLVPVVIGQSAPTEPAAQVEAGSGMDESPNAGRRNLPQRQLTEEELNEALAFVEQNMPNFNRMWSRLPPDRQRRMPPRMQWGFKLMLDAKQAGDQRLYDVLAQQMRLRDEFMSLRRELMRSGGDEEVRQRLMSKVRQLVEAGISQRELRIEKLEKMLEAEKAKLNTDRQDIDAQIEAQYRRLDDETSQFVAFIRRFGPMGGGPGLGAPPTVPTTQPQSR